MTHTELLNDIRENPDKHKHPDLNALTACCMLGGAIDAMVWEAHEGSQGRNGSRGCDVTHGPCACGAWH
jgi:hypothetical protein